MEMLFFVTWYILKRLEYLYTHVCEIVIADFQPIYFFFSNSFIYDTEKEINLLAKKIYLHDDTMTF